MVDMARGDRGVRLRVLAKKMKCRRKGHDWEIRDDWINFRVCRRCGEQGWLV